MIVLHCSGVTPNVHQDISVIDGYHRKKGWNGVGYHEYVRRDGTIQHGRPMWMVGAHVVHHNKYSIGICYEGGLNENGEYADTRTPAQKHALVALLRSLKADYPDAEILGHRDLPGVKKACPCFDAREYEGVSMPPL